jgi:hypothetical protein
MGFDPNEFLAAPAAPAGDDPELGFLKKKPKGGAGSFDPDAFLSAPAGPPARPINNTGPDAAGQLRAEAAALPAQMAKGASTADAIANGIWRGGTFGFSDELEGAAARAKDMLAGRSARNLSDVVAGREGNTYAHYRDQVRQQDQALSEAHPIATGAGQIIGGLATAPLAAVRGAGVANAALNGAIQGGIAGAGNSDADLTKGDVGGLVRDVGANAALGAATSAVTSKIVGGAPERVDKRLVSNISRGEAGGAAKEKLYKNLVAKAGDEFGDLNEVLGRHPGVKEVLATSAAANPAKGAKVTNGVIKGLDEELTPIYRAIDKGPAAPTAYDLKYRLLELQDALKQKGRTDLADHVETFIGHIDKHYPADADILNASMLRELRKGVGQVAFKDIAQANAPAGVQAKRMIYQAINDTIDDAGAKTPGVNVDRLHVLNKDTSTMIAVRDVLADRSAKAAAGRTSLWQNLFSAGVIGGAVGGVTGSTGAGVGAPIAAYAGAKAYGVAQQGLRRADFQLARLVQAARSGSTPAQLAQTAVELGLSREVANQIAQRGIGALQGVRDSEGP